MTKKFLYLVQGEAKLVRSYRDLGNRPHSDAVFLTFDEPLDGALFYPESTWAQGRNKLLDAALEKGAYLYYIFCDDDIEFRAGSWKKFEDNLLKYSPGIGVPVFPRTRGNILNFPTFNYQPFFINDEQLMAFHRDVVHDRLVLPYQTRFDKINWWASCEIQQILIQNFYCFSALQFNEIQVRNTCKERYDIQHDNDKMFREIVLQWMGKQFVNDYRLTAHYTPPRLHQIIFRLLSFSITRSLGKQQRSVNRKSLSKILYPSSDLARQANEKKT